MPLPEQLQDRELMAEVVDNMNVRHTNAQMAGRASTTLHTLIFFRGRSTNADARVVKVRRRRHLRFASRTVVRSCVAFLLWARVTSLL